MKHMGLHGPLHDAALLVFLLCDSEYAFLLYKYKIMDHEDSSKERTYKILSWLISALE